MNELLPSTDNFFKYLLTIGLILIVFTIMYPVQKQKELDLEILNYNSNVEVLNLKIKSLEDEVSEFEKIRLRLQKELDSLKIIKEGLSIEKAQIIEGARIQKKEQFDKLKKDLLNTTDSLLTSRIYINNAREKINKLNGYFSFFMTYKVIFLIVGIFFTVFGFRYWIASAYLEELKKGKEVQMPILYKSSFVRHIEYCKDALIRRWVITLMIIILIALAIIVTFNS